MATPNDERPKHAASAPADLSGRTLDGRYRVDGLLGRGGMGEVWRGEQLSLKRPVAIKVLRHEMAGVASVAERFEREALILSRLDHPGVVRVIDFGRVEESLYLVMELVAGRTLESVLQGGAIEPGRAARILGLACDALSAAHHAGVVHRDLKPDNLVLLGAFPPGSSQLGPSGAPPDESLKILDFGIARILEPQPDAKGLTTTGMVVGTPEYMAPEQATGDPVDTRADLYALGVIGFRMLAGRPPFTGRSAREVLFAHVGAPVPPLLLPGGRPAPEPLAGAIRRALAKEPGQRFATAAAMKSALAGASPAASPPTGVTAGVGRSPRKTVGLTVMLTDIKDYTAKTAAQTREEGERMLALYDSLLMPVIHGFGGVRRKTIGDAFLLTFTSPTDSVLCGAAILDRLADYNAGTAAAQTIEVRVAVSLGDVRLEKASPLSAEAEVVGEPLTAALAVEAVAKAGEVWFTDAVFLAMNRSEVAIEELGSMALRGLSEPRRVYRVRRAKKGARPYGGAALSRLGRLPPPSDRPSSLGSRVLAAVARLSRRASPVSRGRRSR